jgi:hypothetical protein
MEGSCVSHQYACLVGNGLSIAYNEQMTVETLTEGLLDGFGRMAGSVAADALRSLAESVSGAGRGTFEELLSPLEHVGSALEGIRHMTALAQKQAESDAALRTTTEFLEGIRRLGLGMTLELIDSRARGEGQPFEEVTVRTCRAILQLAENSEPGRAVTVASSTTTASCTLASRS